MNRLIRLLKIDIILFRSSGLGCLVMTFLGMATVLTTCGIIDNAISKRETTPEIATIVGFGAYQGSWRAGAVVVSARDQKGITGTTMVRPSQIVGCHVGDKIRAGRYGLMLYPHPAPCPIEVEPHEAETSEEK